MTYSQYMYMRNPHLSPTLTAIFPGVPRLAGFIGAKLFCSVLRLALSIILHCYLHYVDILLINTGMDKWSYKSCKASVNITINKPTPNFLQAGCPSCRPTNSVKALKGKYHIPQTCLTHVCILYSAGAKDDVGINFSYVSVKSQTRTRVSFCICNIMCVGLYV